MKAARQASRKNERERRGKGASNRGKECDGASARARERGRAASGATEPRVGAMECARAGRAGRARKRATHRAGEGERPTPRDFERESVGGSDRVRGSATNFRRNHPRTVTDRGMFSSKIFKMDWYAQRRCPSVALGSSCPPAGAIGRARDVRCQLNPVRKAYARSHSQQRSWSDVV